MSAPAKKKIMINGLTIAIKRCIAMSQLETFVREIIIPQTTGESQIDYGGVLVLCARKYQEFDPRGSESFYQGSVIRAG